jgi:WD40 repeat protein
MVVLVIPGSHSERAPEDVAEPIILDEPVAPATSSLRETWSSEGAVGVLAALIRKMVGSSALKRQVSIATHPGRIACHTLKHITAVVSPCCPNIGIWLADKWASPLLYHPAQESSISAMIWGPLSDTLYVATLEGVLIWSLRFHGLRSMEQAWCLRCDSLPSPLASSLTVSPFGRVFVASSEESTSVTVWDGITSDPVPVSCSGEASGGTVTCMAWAPLGLHILIGFR